uniref:tRNA(Ile)-lysidine/2-thiocytidine synthase N-terminal domain-containing protein n=1 Tax=Caulerpa lentillifera TaxID=148947 RepID=A0A345HH01_9CHLO|nr:hypothetical protein [Caulerpa lentillifera]AXG75891.1 hypothetical protein [Caulerpa lentillifera]QKS32298.1 hypothetical protein [Caulerpa lentillifera]QUV75700.1 tRNA(Ile)-lysidine synthase [Caulerpa lentillifera]
MKTILHLWSKQFSPKVAESDLIAFSGGQDSTNLIILWTNLNYSRRNSCVWCNHLWKKEDFYLFRHSFQISFILYKPFLSTIFFSKVFGEQKARKNRYNSFLRICNYSYFDSLLTGHTQNDQIETFFINLFRGSGKFGLHILPSSQIFLNSQCSQNFPFG